MHRKYLGDSFDIVKRFWADRLEGIAPLLAHPRFIPVDIRSEFETMVGMRVMGAGEKPSAPFGLFLDPHTGIPLPSPVQRGVSVSHVPLAFIETMFAELQPTYVICFDQSSHRIDGLTSSDQRSRKRADLRARGLCSFYYVSHAPFLFVAADHLILDQLRRRLVESGIPASRFESEATEMSTEDGS